MARKHEIKRDPDATLGEALIFGDQNEIADLLDIDLALAHGKNRRDMKWKTIDLKFGHLVQKLLSHSVAKEKDGACFTQGSLVTSRRIANNVDKLDLLVLDMDTGQPIEEVREKIIAEGLLAIIYTTHSHLATRSDVLKDTLVRSMKLDADDEITDAVVQTYFSMFAKYDPSIVKTLRFEAIEHVEGGIKVFVSHAPMPKYRIVFLLDEPFVMAEESSSQKNAIIKWKKKYAGVAQHLGAFFDRSCVDPSRLFYFPTHKEGALYRNEIIIGEPLRLDSIKDGNPNGMTATNAFIEAGLDEQPTFDEGEPIANRWVDTFLKEHGKNFFASDFFRDMLETRKDDGEHVTTVCPFDDEHSNAGDPADMGFHAWNPGWNKLDRGGAACSHDTCKPRKTRHYLDRLAEDGLIASPDDLMPYVEGIEEDDDDGSDDDTDTKGPVENNSVAPSTSKADAGPDKETPPWEDEDYPEEIRTLLKKIGRLKKADEEGIRKLFGMILDAKLGDIALNLLFDHISRQTGVKVTDLKRTYMGMRKESAKEQAEAATERVMIFIKDPFDAQIENAKKGLLAQNKEDPRLFKLDGVGMCRVSKSAEGLHLGDAQRELIDRNGLFKELNEALFWFDEGPGGRTVNRSTPLDVVNHFLGLEQHALPFPTLLRLVKHPIFSAEGKLHVKNGYDYDSSAYLDLNFTPLPVPKKPSNDDVDAALDLIFDDLLVDFPFKDKGDVNGVASKANMLAMMLQPFVRDIIGEGNTPMFLIDKPVPGAGSGKLADMLAYILSGERVQTSTYKKDDVEVEKEIISKLRISSDGIMFFDNVNYRVDSQTLASAITSGKFSARLLGGNTIFTAPTRHVWMMSGNNVTFANEMLRRLVPITLVPDEADPALRTKFKHADLDTWALDHRAELIQALCVIVQRWIADGMPNWEPGEWSDAKVMGGFETWSHVIGGILDSAGVEGFLENQAGFKVGAGFDDETEVEFIAEIGDRVGYETPFTAGFLHEKFWDESNGAGGGYLIDIPGVHRTPQIGKRNLVALIHRIKLRKFPIYEEAEKKSYNAWLEQTSNDRSGALRFMLRRVIVETTVKDK